MPRGHLCPPAFFIPMKSPEFEVGEHVRTLREGKGMLQRELAQTAGLPLRTIGRIERGEVDVRLSTLIKIATALKVDVKELLP